MRALCGLLLEKKKRRLARPRTGKLSWFSSQCFSEPWERATRSQKQRDKDKGRGDSDFDRICNPISRLRWWLKSKVQLCYVVRTLEIWDFSFSAWQAHSASNAGERVDMELISQHIRQILAKNTMGCANREENCFFPFIYHQLQVCGWGICMSLGWVMNSFQPAGTPTTRLISAVCMFAHVIWVVFFPLVVGVREWKDVLEKEGLF